MNDYEPKLTRTRTGRLASPVQLAILERIARANGQGEYPSAYAASQNKSHGYQAIRHLISLGLLAKTTAFRTGTAELFITIDGWHELAYWRKYPPTTPQLLKADR